jgi:hypothetical protein
VHRGRCGAGGGVMMKAKKRINVPNIYIVLLAPLIVVLIIAVLSECALPFVMMLIRYFRHS